MALESKPSRKSENRLYTIRSAVASSCTTKRHGDCWGGLAGVRRKNLLVAFASAPLNRTRQTTSLTTGGLQSHPHLEDGTVYRHVSPTNFLFCYEIILRIFGY